MGVTQSAKLLNGDIIAITNDIVGFPQISKKQVVTAPIYGPKKQTHTFHIYKPQWECSAFWIFLNYYGMQLDKQHYELILYGLYRERHEDR